MMIFWFVELKIFTISFSSFVSKICEELKKNKLKEKKLDKKPDNKTSYIDLVISLNRPKCPIISDPKTHIRNIKKYETGTYPDQGPYVKLNPFKIMSTKVTLFINYLWDYLDEMVIKKIENKKSYLKGKTSKNT